MAGGRRGLPPHGAQVRIRLDGITTPPALPLLRAIGLGSVT
jgi:hypothetical protein